MIINKANLTNLTTGFKAAFQSAFAEVKPTWKSYATYVKSTTAIETYAWLGQFPGMREWIGDRVIKNLETEGYQIRNRDFEQTVAVKRNAIEDDQYGVYTPMMAAMGAAAGTFPDELTFGQLKLGFTANGYDRQFFFDTDHPVRQGDGSVVSVSNLQAGASTPWFLLDLSKPVKPVIFQDRRPITFVAKDDPRDDNVFDRAEFVYGADGRMATGFAFWQLAFGSRANLTTANFDLAYDSMTVLKGDEGRPLAIKPTHLVIPPQLRKAADEVIRVQRLAGGADNPNYARVEVVEVPWLA